MTSPDASYTGPPSILDHDLNKHFPELLKFESTPEMEASELYKQIRPEVERVMNAVVVESLSGQDSPPYARSEVLPPPRRQVVLTRSAPSPGISNAASVLTALSRLSKTTKGSKTKTFCSSPSSITAWPAAATALSRRRSPAS